MNRSLLTCKSISNSTVKLGNFDTYERYFTLYLKIYNTLQEYFYFISVLIILFTHRHLHKPFKIYQYRNQNFVSVKVTLIKWVILTHEEPLIHKKVVIIILLITTNSEIQYM